MALTSYKVLNLKITILSKDAVINNIEKSISLKHRYLIAPISAYESSFAYINRDFSEKLTKFNLLLADGFSIVKSINFLYNREYRVNQRIRGIALMKKVMREAEKREWKVLIYGTNKETLQKLKKSFRNLYPNLCKVEYLPAPERISSKTKIQLNKEIIKIYKNINHEKINIVFISLGSPYQYIFSYLLAHYKRIFRKSVVIIPIGAAVDFLSENKKEAPKIIQNLGMEWFYRFINEPFRLWKRYLLYSFLFLIFILFQKTTLLLKDK